MLAMSRDTTLRDGRSNLSFSDLASDCNEAGQVGQEVWDGKFAFVVSEIDACLGQPVKVTLKVSNTCARPHTFCADDQVLMRASLAQRAKSQRVDSVVPDATVRERT
ncbi:hypothetical protein A5670_10455 [Mycolicibacterium fortuitum]|nr:hypothetical protein A5670_10455 [Mycolicibacterium fortuitum]